MMEYYYGSIALLAPVYSITKSLPLATGGCTRQRYRGGALKAEGYGLLEIETNKI